MGKAVNKQSNRAVTGVQLHRFQHILLHCVWLAVIANHAERFIRSKQSVRAGKRLYNVLVFQHLIHIEGINPLGVKAGQHLVNNDQQIKLLVGGAFNALILLLVRQTQRQILLKPCMGRYCKILPIALIVILDNFNKPVLFVNRAAVIINVRVKKAACFQFRHGGLHHAVIFDCLRDAACGKNRVEFTVVAQGQPVFLNILDNGLLMLGRQILCIGQIILNPLDPLSVRTRFAVHFHLRVVHVLIVHSCFCRVVQGICNRSCLCFFQCNSLPHIFVAEGKYLVRVKAQHIFIADAVCYAVTVQLIAKHIGLCVVLFGVFLKHGRAGKAEENRARKGFFYNCQHIAKGGAMRLVHDKHQSLFADQLNIAGIFAALLVTDIAHLLNRCHNQRVCGGNAFQLGNQYIGVFCCLHGLVFIGKGAVFFQRLRSQLDAIREENHLVRIVGIGNQLCGLEGGHRLAAAGGVPDIPAALLAAVPFRFGNHIRNRTGGIILIAAHNFQHAVRIVGHGVKADQLMRHGDGQQLGGNLFPIVDWLVVEVRPVEVIIGVKFAIGTGVGEVNGFFRVHCHKNLHKREQSGKHTLVGVFFDLVICLTHRHTAAL